jgi:hypothetical protein
MSIRKTWRVRAFAGALVGLLLAGGFVILGAGSRPATAQGNELWWRFSAARSRRHGERT